MTFAVHAGLGSAAATAVTARVAGSQDSLRSLAAAASPSSIASLSLSRSLSFAPLPRKAPSPLRAQATEEAYLEQGASGDAETPAGVKLYVGNLPWNVDSGTLAEIFQEAGVVEEVEVICDRDTGRSRGFAFVVMSTPEEAQKAMEQFDGSDLGGRPLRVNYPTPQGERRERAPARGMQQQRGMRPAGGAGAGREENPNKLYVGNLSWGVDDMALQELFSEFGKVMEARVVMDRDTGRSRGFGFVTLGSQDEVSQAVNNLDGAEFDGRQLRVNPAAQKPRA